MCFFSIPNANQESQLFRVLLETYNLKAHRNLSSINHSFNDLFTAVKSQSALTKEQGLFICIGNGEDPFLYSKHMVLSLLDKFHQAYILCDSF